MTEVSVGEVALATGFSDESHFTKTSRQYDGMTVASTVGDCGRAKPRLRDVLSVQDRDVESSQNARGSRCARRGV